jgi:putative 4-mercaptohistidine N1-methyltranferase
MTPVVMSLDPKNPYETEALVNQYMEFHYGDSYFGVENYPRRCADLCLQATAALPRRKALDLGCAVGRSTFELARFFDSAIGLDLSARFIGCANHLRLHRSLDYAKPIEGARTEQKRAELSPLGLDEASSRVDFAVADACELDRRYTDLDLIFAGNLLDRLYDPGRFLRSIQERLRPGGILVISSPYTWLEAFTPREKWLAGYAGSTGYVSTLEGMRRILTPGFQLAQPPVDVPFVIRETARKFQHSIAELSVWRRAQ